MRHRAGPVFRCGREELLRIPVVSVRVMKAVVIVVPLTATALRVGGTFRFDPASLTQRARNARREPRPRADATRLRRPFAAVLDSFRNELAVGGRQLARGARTRPISYARECGADGNNDVVQVRLP